jgi:hypothetical protein
LPPPPAPPAPAAPARPAALAATATRPGPNVIKAPALRAVPGPSTTPIASSRAVVTCPTCKSLVPAAVGQLDYVCAHCKGAFRY